MADMDIEMDVDLGFTEDDLAFAQSNVIPAQAPIISVCGIFQLIGIPS